MSTDWCSVRITFLCSRHIDPAGVDDLIVQINDLVRTRYPNQVANLYVDLPDTPDFFGHAGSSSRGGHAGA